MSDLIKELKSYPEHYMAAHKAADRIVALEAALDDLSGYVSRADWHYLKTDTVALLWGKNYDAEVDAIIYNEMLGGER